MILREENSPKHKNLFKILQGSEIFGGVYYISKSTNRRILIFAPIDCLSIIHCDTLNPLFFEFFLTKNVAKLLIFIFEDNSLQYYGQIGSMGF